MSVNGLPMEAGDMAIDTGAGDAAIIGEGADSIGLNATGAG